MSWHIHPVAYPNGTDTILESKAPLEYNQWYMVTCTQKAGSAKLYLNGELQEEEAIAEAPSVFQGFTRCHIARSNWDDRYFMGEMDELTIWNSELTQEEVTNLYNVTAVDKFKTVRSIIYSYGGNIRIKLDNTVKNATATVYNVIGEQVLRRNNLDSFTEISGLKAGVYIVKVNYGNNTDTQKVIIQ